MARLGAAVPPKPHVESRLFSSSSAPNQFLTSGPMNSHRRSQRAQRSSESSLCPAAPDSLHTLVRRRRALPSTPHLGAPLIKKKGLLLACQLFRGKNDFAKALDPNSAQLTNPLPKI